MGGGDSTFINTRINSRHPYKHCTVVKDNKNSIIWEIVKGSGLKSHVTQIQIAVPTIISCVTLGKFITSQFLVHLLGLKVLSHMIVLG